MSSAGTVVAVATLQGSSTSRVWCTAWSPTGQLLASSSGDTTIRIWGKDSRTGEWGLRVTLEGAHSRTVRSVAWSPCGNFLASASFDGTACIWDRSEEEFECVATLEGHENEVKDVAWSASGALLATCSRDKTVWIWEIEDSPEDFDVQCLSVLNSHTQDVKAVAWHPETETLASASYDNTLKLFRDDPQDWLCCETMSGHTSTVWKLAFSPSGDRIASCSDDQTIKIWKAYHPGNPQGIETNGTDAKWKSVCTLSGYHDRPVYDIAWSQTGLIATAGGDNKIIIFQEGESSSSDTPNFSVVATLTDAHSEDVNCIAWSPSDPTLLVSGSDDGLIKIWKVEV